MNEHLFSTASQQQAETMLAIRKSSDWQSSHPKFADYVAERWSLSKSRANFLCNFAIFYGFCRKANLELPETPENVKPILSLPQKRWLETWEVVLAYKSDLVPVNAKHCQSVMDRFGIIARRRLPQDVLDGIRLRRASKTLAELGDGEALAERVGKRGFGRNWDDAVTTVIDADQARRNVHE